MFYLLVLIGLAIFLIKRYNNPKENVFVVQDRTGIENIKNQILAERSYFNMLNAHEHAKIDNSIKMMMAKEMEMDSLIGRYKNG